MTGFRTLRVENAGIVIDGVARLSPLSLTLESPGITVILGHNGAGKSLFVKMCHGLMAPSGGQVLWNGRAAADTRQERAFLFQNTPLLRRSVRANVEFPLLARGVAKPERQARVATALETARLTDYARTPAARLSGGERQRLALARALVAAPSVILLDEPAASLDPASTRELETALRDIAAGGTKIMLVTHDIAQARRLADDVLMFGNGKLLAFEAADSFFTRPQNGAIADYLEGRI